MKNESQIFSIGIEKPSRPRSKITMGFIQIGNFEERFEVVLHYWNSDTYLKKWSEALRRLVERRRPVALLTRMLDPQSCDYLRAWTFFPEGDSVFIREQLFVHPAKKVKFDSDEHIVNLKRRETTTKVSEWKTTLGAIKAALKS